MGKTMCRTGRCPHCDELTNASVHHTKGIREPNLARAVAHWLKTNVTAIWNPWFQSKYGPNTLTLTLLPRDFDGRNVEMVVNTKTGRPEAANSASPALVEGPGRGQVVSVDVANWAYSGGLRLYNFRYEGTDWSNQPPPKYAPAVGSAVVWPTLRNFAPYSRENTRRSYQPRSALVELDGLEYGRDMIAATLTRFAPCPQIERALHLQFAFCAELDEALTWAQPFIKMNKDKETFEEIVRRIGSDSARVLLDQMMERGE